MKRKKTNPVVKPPLDNTFFIRPYGAIYASLTMYQKATLIQAALDGNSHILDKDSQEIMKGEVDFLMETSRLVVIPVKN